MKFAIFSLLSILALTQAQSLSGLPQCAYSCALNAIGATGCSATDAKCICTHQAFLSQVESCITTACSPADQAQTLKFAETFCGSAGVTITLPSSSVAASSVLASSVPASSAVVSTTAVPVSQISDGQPQVSTAAPAVSQISDGQPQAPTETPATFTGAAVRPMVQEVVGGLVGLGLGMGALL